MCRPGAVHARTLCTQPPTVTRVELRLLLLLTAGVLGRRGVINLGPPKLTEYENIGENIIEGITISGAGIPACTNRSTGPVLCTGLHMDSSEPFVGGSCYQNVVRDIKITAVDAGVYMGKYVNANHLSGVMLSSIGRFGYLLVNNTENSVFGGFSAGDVNGHIHHTVITGKGSGYNWFVSVQAEPGAGSSYFSFDNRSEANAVIGHDNTAHGAASADPSFLYQEGRSFHMGNFRQSAGGDAMGAEHCVAEPAGNAVPCLMQIEGTAYIKNLTAFGLRCASKGGPKVDVCGDVELLREKAATQERQLKEQEGRIARLEQALASLLKTRKNS
jgi:hypothetical protein